MDGEDQLKTLLEWVRREAVEPGSVDRFLERLAPALRPPGDGTKDADWEKAGERAREYDRTGAREALWSLIGRLHGLMRWYASRSVTRIRGVGEKRADQLTNLGIETLFDLAHHFPRAYTDRRYVDAIAELESGQRVNVLGEVVSAGVVRGRKPRFELRLGDDTGVLQINFWNQTYLSNQISRGNTLFCSGSCESFRGTLQMNNPDFEIIETRRDLDDSRSIRPIYGLTEGVSQNRMRNWVQSALSRLDPLWVDCLPSPVRKRRDLPRLSWSMNQIHAPDSIDTLERARSRLIFEEFFFYQLLFVLQGWQVEQTPKSRVYPDRSRVEQYLRNLPFSLTEDQTRALETIESDLTGDHPMHRLLQGDVGTGKTVVAAASLLRVCENGHQTALMAPTEVLAEQHHLTLRRQLEDVSCEPRLLIGSLPSDRKEKLRNRLEGGDIDLVVGTHALIQKRVDFSSLGYVVIDEQHRFGVEQRKRLREKGPDVDMLIMSATPIPRSLALSVYGDLSVSTLETFPTGPKRITTELRDQTRAQRREIYGRIRSRVREGERAFFVFPAIEGENEDELMAAREAFERARRSSFFEDVRLGLLHGRMDRDEKRRIMNRFRDGEVQILFCTTVIEVGIDVPEASFLVVHDAEQFGLAQLHQLRGRIGRGGQEAFCYLMIRPESPDDSVRRLEVLERTLDGFEVSRADLRQRGIGEMAGTRQSGRADFRIGNLWEHRATMDEAREEAERVVSESGGLREPEFLLTRRKLEAEYDREAQYIQVG